MTGSMVIFSIYRNGCVHVLNNGGGGLQIIVRGMRVNNKKMRTYLAGTRAPYISAT